MPIDKAQIKWDSPAAIDTSKVQWDEPSSFMQGAGNLAAGALRGAGSIGATAMRILPNALGGDTAAENEARRQQMDAALQSMGAQPDSLLYKGGKLGAEVAGTAGAGGALAKGVATIAPALTSAGRGAQVINALKTGGFTLGGPAATTLGGKAVDLGIRTAGGALSGGAAAGLVNPEDAATGAMIGGALPGGVQAAGAVGGALKSGVAGLTKNALGLSTGTGGEAVGTAYRAGKQGGTSFLDNMRGNVPMTDVLDSAKSALGQMRLDRSNAYKSGMSGVSADKTVIDFSPIDKAVASLQSMGNYKGQVINKNSSGVVDEISGLVNQWKSLDPAEFHTPEGLDALKQAISDIRDTTQFGTAARKAADTAYNAVKGEIVSQAPTYSKVMKDYSQASETLSEVERALSLGNKSAADTSMRKLQSLMRNNVNTNFGNRVGLAKTLEENGAEILPAVAGQAMSSWTPRGLQGAVAGGTGIASISNPLLLAGLPTTSPRLVGEAAYGLGAASRGVSNAGSAAKSKLLQLLNQGNAIGMEQFSPFIATAPVLAGSQRVNQR